MLKKILKCPTLSCVFCLMFAELPLMIICPIFGIEELFFFDFWFFDCWLKEFLIYLEFLKLKYFDEYNISYNKYVEYT